MSDQIDCPYCSGEHKDGAAVINCQYENTKFER